MNKACFTYYIFLFILTSVACNISTALSTLRDEFIKAQTMELVDPVDVPKLMEQLYDQINAFEVNVDSALSVSNALTTIEVTY